MLGETGAAWSKGRGGRSRSFEEKKRNNSEARQIHLPTRWHGGWIPRLTCSLGKGIPRGRDGPCGRTLHARAAVTWPQYITAEELSSRDRGWLARCLASHKHATVRSGHKRRGRNCDGGWLPRSAASTTPCGLCGAGVPAGGRRGGAGVGDHVSGWARAWLGIEMAGWVPARSSRQTGSGAEGTPPPAIATIHPSCSGAE